MTDGLHLVKRSILAAGPATRKPPIMAATNVTITGSTGFAPNETTAGPGQMPLRPQPVPNIAAPDDLDEEEEKN